MFLRKYKYLRQFNPYFKKHKWLIAALFCVMVIASSMGMVIAYLISEQLISITSEVTAAMIKVTIMVIIAFLIHHFCWYMWERFAAILLNRVSRELRINIIEKMLDTKYKEISKNPSGFYIERLQSGVERIAGYFASVTGSMIDAATNLGFLVVIYFLNWQCGLFFSLGIIVLVALEVLKIKKDTKYLAKLNSHNAKLTSSYNETIIGIKEIKGLGVKGRINAENIKLQQQNSDLNFEKAVKFGFWDKLRSFVQQSFDAALVLMCAFWLFPAGQVTVIVLLIIFTYKYNAYQTVGFFSTIKKCYMQGDLGAKQVLEITQGLQSEKWGTQSRAVANAMVEVKNLTFNYDTEKILNNISFKAQANSCSVFIGASGSGKTTLFSLLAKLLETENGKIFIGGFDINSFDEQSFRQTVCIINQEPFIFNNTVENNIKIVKPDASKEEVILACKKANIHEQITGFPDGYETEIHENGANLSGGQKQRIAIARAILKDTPIILFDEPTSALDKENQAQFYEVLKELKKTKTILVIAHKLGSYELFDNVFEIKDGAIAV